MAPTIPPAHERADQRLRRVAMSCDALSRQPFGQALARGEDLLPRRCQLGCMPLRPFLVLLQCGEGVRRPRDNVRENQAGTGLPAPDWRELNRPPCSLPATH